MNTQLIICLVIFGLTVIGYCSGLYSLATVAITSLLALTLTGCLDAASALTYFSNAPSPFKTMNSYWFIEADTFFL